MGMVYAEIDLLSGEDVIAARHGRLPEAEIRRAHVEAVVDTGVFMLSITEPIRQQLGLPTTEQVLVRLADGSRITADVVGPVELRFANRRALVEALVIPGDAGEVLLGANPLEHMDVLVDPLRQRLVVNPAHPDRPVFRMVGMRPLPLDPDAFRDDP
jgi:clan AA aspartic protease